MMFKTLRKTFFARGDEKAAILCFYFNVQENKFSDDAETETNIIFG